MFVSTFGAGMAMGMPDVCKTPPFAIPAPFPDIGNNAMCIPGYFTILTAGMPDLNLLSMYAITQGDEAGVMGGVVSQVFIGPARPVMGSQAVFVAGVPVWRLTDPTLHNLCNAPGFAAAPSQTTKLALRYDPSEVAFKGQFVSESHLQHRIRCWNPPAVPHFL